MPKTCPEHRGGTEKGGKLSGLIQIESKSEAGHKEESRVNISGGEKPGSLWDCKKDSTACGEGERMNRS